MRRVQQRLAIWMNGIPMGYWEKHKGEGRDWIADSQGRPLSSMGVLMPVSVWAKAWIKT
jgi:hypothetical protein